MNSKTNIITISGVDCYEQDGTVYLNLETVARGLGFTDNSKSSLYVRWNTVRQYLGELGFSQEVAKDTYIPENIFYRLAMKARNETAEAFQAKVADEIIPAIRKTGSYSVSPAPMSTAEMFLAQAKAMVELEQQSRAITQRLDTQQQTLEKAVSVFSLPTVEVEHWRDEMNTHISRVCETYGLSQQVFRGETYAELEDTANVILSSRVKRKQERMRKAGAKYRERVGITKLHVISEDEKLRAIYESIIRKRESQLCVSKHPASAPARLNGTAMYDA